MDNSPEFDKKRVELYTKIHNYHSLGFSNRAIAKTLHCGRTTVTKYLDGDYESLCRKDNRSAANQFLDYIVKGLSAGSSRMEIYKGMLRQGYPGKLTSAYDFMNRIIKKLGIETLPGSSNTAEALQKKKELQQYEFVSRSQIFRFLWMDAEIPETQKVYLLDNYPQIREMLACVRAFREIFQKKHMPLLYLFIERFKGSNNRELSRFAGGLERDIAAVENSVASPLSSGFVEGTNNKLKMIKRTMYERCSKELLAAKLILSL